jgi:MFS family permease
MTFSAVKENNSVVLLVTSVAHFINDGESAVLPVLIPLLAYSISSSFELAAVAACFYLFSSFGSPFAVSRVARSGNTGRGMGEGLLILGTGIALLGISTAFLGPDEPLGYAGTIVSACIAGFGSSYYHPIGSGIIQKSFGDGATGLALGVNGSVGSFGRAIFLTISVVAFEAAMLSGGLLIIGTACIIIAAPIMLFFHFSEGEAKPSAGTVNVRRWSRVLPTVRGTWPLIVMTFVRSAASTGIILYLPTYFIREHLIPYGLDLGLMMTFIMSLPIPGQIAIGWLSGRIGAVRTLFLTTLMSGVFVLVFLLYPLNIYFDAASLALFSLFAFSGFPILFPIATKMVEEADSPLSRGVIWTAVGSGSAASPMIVVLLSEVWAMGSLQGSFLILSLATVIVSALSFSVRITRSQKKPASP